MKSGLYTIIEFAENDKWFVIGETTYNGENYNYLIKVTPDETDFIEEFMTVKCLNVNGEEYFDEVKDQNILKEIMPSLIPGVEELLKNPEEALKELMKN